MGKAGKITAGLVVAALVIIVLVVFLAFQNLDKIIAQVIEGTGTQVTQTRVKVSGVELSLADGRGAINGLSIGNPPGYDADSAFRMNTVVLQVEPASLTGKVIVIKEISSDGATLTAEQKGTGNNLKDLLDNIREAGAGEAPAESSGGPSDVRLMVERFAFTNASANLVTSQWGEKTMKVPDIVLTNIGDRETGLTPEQLGGRVTEALVKQVEKAVTAHLGQLAKEAASKEINKKLDEKIGSENRDKLDQLKNMMKKDG